MMSDPVSVGTSAAVILVTAIAGVIKSYRSGKLGEVVNQFKAKRVAEKLDSIGERVDETYEATERNGDKIDEVAETIVLLHKNDEHVSETQLRRKVGVDSLETDIFKENDTND